jgi:adenosylhomocysteine nucleosidase
MNLILIAIKDEAPSLANNSSVFFTGVGKVNAAMTAAALITQYRPDRVINFGTAGGITVGTGLYQCTRFIQRDMACEVLGCVPGQTPFEADVYLGDQQGLTCSTGDNFVMNPDLTIPTDVVDMEAYAIAKVCKRYNIPFLCWKYVTDSADASAHADWNSMVSAGESYYLSQLELLGIRL